MIHFDNVGKSYSDGTEAVKALNLTIENGELMALIGPSGCGKTTTLKMINRLIEPTAGSIKIHNKDIREYNIHELRWNTGYVLQEIALFPHMTIEENITIVPEMRKWKKSDINHRVSELMEMVGLDPATFRKRQPDELSGGQQQRVGVIRALAADPDIILMDEPFSALDPITREQLQNDVRHLQKEIKKTIVFVTHDIDEAMALGDRVCLMKDGEIVQVDKPQQLILHPKNDFVKSFIGEKKSPWQTAVDILMDRSMSRTVTLPQIEEQNVNPSGSYIIIGHEGEYIGTLINGEKIVHPELPNYLQLVKTIETFRANKTDLLPVVKNDRVIGTLSYEDIVHFLESKTKKENGVIQ
ncbi:ABC transporter ATP-binding protein [Sediminibacillus albus]|uniref:Carnitine transport ATP-binding protein OpuCA n=1 Tax=Sediminibacillus albus TaxID=407036 RepID=A0A1G8VVV1_9BACI|nr:ABC transporter ATP-binding protein [Sediminibacillus albus]SDJ70119.1 osmoprotectant transport system ATP-binding protein [Sediminibacillus albus]